MCVSKRGAGPDLAARWSFDAPSARPVDWTTLLFNDWDAQMLPAVLTADVLRSEGVGRPSPRAFLFFSLPALTR